MLFAKALAAVACSVSRAFLDCFYLTVLINIIGSIARASVLHGARSRQQCHIISSIYEYRRQASHQTVKSAQ